MNRFDCEIDSDVSTLCERHFTAQEANAALVLVSRIAADVTAGYRRLMDLQEVLEAAQTARDRDRSDSTRRDLIRIVEKLQSCLQELDDVGVELKDWALGLVDFPCMASGREVVLCWQHGETGVAHWHELNEDCSNRQPLSALRLEQVAV